MKSVKTQERGNIAVDSSLPVNWDINTTATAPHLRDFWYFSSLYSDHFESWGYLRITRKDTVVFECSLRFTRKYDSVKKEMDEKYFNLDFVLKCSIYSKILNIMKTCQSKSASYMICLSANTLTLYLRTLNSPKILSDWNISGNIPNQT